MKIKRTINYKHKPKFLKIKLLKTQIYRNKFKQLKIENIEYRLKKILHVIYQFHINNKTILFAGTPMHLHKQVTKLISGTKHIFIPNNIWINGAITNQHTIFKYLLKSKSNNKTNAEILFQLKKKIDLIVVLNEQDNKTILNEGYISKTPVISLDSNLDIMNNKSIYKVPGNFDFTSKKISNSFFYSILKASLKKSNISIKATQNRLKPVNFKLQNLTKTLLKKKQNVTF